MHHQLATNHNWKYKKMWKNQENVWRWKFIIFGWLTKGATSDAAKLAFCSRRRLCLCCAFKGADLSHFVLQASAIFLFWSEYFKCLIDVILGRGCDPYIYIFQICIYANLERCWLSAKSMNPSSQPERGVPTAKPEPRPKHWKNFEI